MYNFHSASFIAFLSLGFHSRDNTLPILRTQDRSQVSHSPMCQCLAQSSCCPPNQAHSPSISANMMILSVFTLGHFVCEGKCNVPASMSSLLSVMKPSVASAPHSPAPVAPNTKNIKQMLLDWCRIKTEPYEVQLRFPLSLEINLCYLELTAWYQYPYWFSIPLNFAFTLYRGLTSRTSPPAGVME